MNLTNLLWFLLGLSAKWIIYSFGYIMGRMGENIMMFTCGINEIAD